MIRTHRNSWASLAATGAAALVLSSSIAAGPALAAPTGAARAGVIAGEVDVAALPSLPGRISGDDRYATSAEIAKVWNTHFDGNTVFVATGANFPDALAASAAAAHLGAPVLLVEKTSLPASVKKQINAISPSRIIVLGSSAAISSSVVTALGKLAGSPQVVRWQGADRYETAATIVKKAWGVNGNGDAAEGVTLSSVIIATGRNFPDAASAAAAAGATGGAVILVDGDKSSIPSSTLNLIKDLAPQRIAIAGTSAAVSSGIESKLKSTFGSGKVTRLGGADRYVTSAKITDFFFDSVDGVFFATGERFPDALTGAALAGQLGVPVLTARRNCVAQDTATVVTGLGATTRVLLGSSASLLSAVAQLTVCPKHSLDDPNSLWVVVNKKRPLNPKSWVPQDLVQVNVPYVNKPYLRKEAAKAVETMFAAFKKETGKQMQSRSAYRSYAAQQQVYTGNDLLQARPGYSEHQTGLVIDVDALPLACSLTSCFADTPQGKWLAKNAWKYGFILRYPQGKTSVTGYQYEPWHYRYVGKELAKAMHDSGITTLEEYFGLPAAPKY